MIARFVVCVGLLVGIGRAQAQPAAAIGSPISAPDLAKGTVTVRVIDGSIAMPHADIVVWLSAGGAMSTMATDDAGRATFTGVTAGVLVEAGIGLAGGGVALSESFPMPATGGVRVMLTTVSAAPAIRTRSGVAIPDDTAAAGTLSVQLTYNDLADAHPPAQVPVALVGYAADGTVTATTQRTDAKGVAHFGKLDRSGATAYYAIASLPRAGHADRLLGGAVIPTGAGGTSQILSAELRTASAPPIDDLAPAAIPKGKLHVVLSGATAPGSQVRVVDAATGKTLATTTAEAEATLAQPAAGAVYVEATVRGKAYRSRPFAPVGDRGAEVAIYVYPRVLVMYELVAEPEVAGISTRALLVLQNSAWIPYPGPVALPLPAGATHATLADDDRALATATDTALTLSRTLAPGKTTLRASFDVAAGADGKVHWDLALPFGAYASAFRIVADPGVAIAGAPVPPRPVTTDTTEYSSVGPFDIMPPNRMAMTIALPKLTAGEERVARACHDLAPDRGTALRGRLAPELHATALDGKPWKLSSLRGTPVLVNFTATWCMPSDRERPGLASLASALGNQLAVVLVASDANPTAVAQKLGTRLPVVLDPPPATGNIGRETLAWGTHLLPESYLVDRRGVVRMYFASDRDWSTPGARACLEALAHD